MKVLLQKLFYAVVLVFAGFGMYSAWNTAQGFIDNFQEEKTEVVRKISPVKPRFARNQSADPVDTKVKDEFTFFETLNDPSMEKMVGLNGFHLPSGDPEPASLSGNRSSSQEKNPPIAEPSIQPKIVQVSNPFPVPERVPEKVPTISFPETEAAFSVQVGSFREKRYGEAMKFRLEKKGYPVFLTGKKSPGGGTWYRVYIGRYFDRVSALDAAGKIWEVEALKTMVVRNPTR